MGSWFAWFHNTIILMNFYFILFYFLIKKIVFPYFLHKGLLQLGP
jgi:hypothetical protein